MPITIEKRMIPTYPEQPYECLPMFAENRVHQRSSGNPYPNAVVNGMHADTIENREYITITLENDYVAVTVLPELGGRIFRAYDKRNGYDFFYRQSVIKPALIGALGSWISGGVEFNWPYHHRPSTFLPVDYATETEADGTMAVHLSEHDPFDRMKGMVTLRLRPDATVLETAVRIFNRTPLRHSFLWWENAAVPVHEDYHIFFPGDVRRAYFHYRRDTAAYPIGSGFYNGHNFGDAANLERHGDIRFATSLFADTSRYDFFGGYDKRKNCGVVHVANRHTSPGKKLFTWGYGDLAHAWEKALTDSGGAYAELMASAYSSNQPDFSWIEPYETKCFSQFWYPLSATGIPFYADRNFSLSAENDTLIMGTTGKERKVTVRLAHAGDVICEKEVRLSCLQNAVIGGLPVSAAECTVTVLENGRSMLSYAPPEKCGTEVSLIGDLPLPEDITSAEDAYRVGLHMRQYRDPKGDPCAYYQRALTLDKNHISVKTALAEEYIARKRYDDAETLLREVEQTLTKWNRRPESGRVFYLHGICAESTERYDEAREWYWQAAVLSDTANCAYTRVAAMDGMCGDFGAMAEDAGYAVARFPDNLTARMYVSIAYLRMGNTKRAAEITEAVRRTDPLFHLANYTAMRLKIQSEHDFWGGLHSAPDETAMDLYEDLCAIGCADWGKELLSSCVELDKAHKIVYYMIDKTPDASIGIGRTFPFRLCEKKALQRSKNDPDAAYLLGCLCYNDHAYDVAAELWRSLDTPAAKRDLAIRYWREDKRTEALTQLTEALELCETPQLLFEWANVANRCGKSELVCERMALTAPDHLRDDSYLEWVQAELSRGNPDKAYAMMREHRFTPCEGGESAVTSRYLEALYQIGETAYREGRYPDAESAFTAALTLPENLGAGLWNDSPLAPILYGLARTRERLGESAREIYAKILAMRVDFFSDMQNPLLPIWQACALRDLGRTADAEALCQSTTAGFRAARGKTDSGYFATTPFFNCYIDPPDVARRAHYDALIEKSRAIWETAFHV